jgi:hypothetical protein
VIPKEIIDKVGTGIAVMDSKGQYPEMGPSVYGMGLERGTYRGFGKRGSLLKGVDWY